MEFILRDVGLNDNTLTVPEKGYIFRGGFIAVIKEYSFLNSWTNKETITRFRKRESLVKYLKKHYNDVVDDLDFTGTCIE